MPSFNKVIVLGNVTRDVELKYTPRGTAVTQIGLAINRVYQDDQGRKVEEVTFIDVELWGRTAEIAGEYLAKGRPVLIEGRLKLDQWDDKQSGQKKSKLKVIGESMQLLGGKPEGQQSQQPAQGQRPPPRQPAKQPQKERDPFLDPPPEDDSSPFE